MNTNETCLIRLLITALPSLKSPQKNFGCWLYNFLCLQLWGHWTESHLISTRCTELIADYSAEIKIVIFQSVSECPNDEWRSSSNCGWIAAKIARFNIVNPEIIGRKFSKFVHDVARLLSLNLLKADLWSFHFISVRCRTLKQIVNPRNWSCHGRNCPMSNTTVLSTS